MGSPQILVETVSAVTSLSRFHNTEVALCTCVAIFSTAFVAHLTAADASNEARLKFK